MQPFTNILVGIDYSKNSENALREAARIAGWNDGELHCVHIIEDEVISIFRKQKDFDEFSVMKTALKHLEEHVENILGSNHRCQCHLRTGHPFKEMLEEIKRRNTSLLVLGSQGLASRDTDTMGALAQRCVRKAPVEVLLVRKHQQTPYQRIIVCVDFSETSKRAAYIAADITIQDNAHVELLHIHSPPSYPYGDGVVVPSLTTNHLKSYLTQQTEKLELMAEKLRASCVDIPVDVTILQDGIFSGIQKHVDMSNADLVVLGTRGKTGIPEFFLGTKAERIIEASGCSVLAIKPEGFQFDIS